MVDLQYTESLSSPSYSQIARFDHNPTDPDGHNIRKEGIHIDASRKSGREVTFYPQHSHVPTDLGVVIRSCANYFDAHADAFVDFYEGSNPPGMPPRWP